MVTVILTSVCCRDLKYVNIYCSLYTFVVWCLGRDSSSNLSYLNPNLSYTSMCRVFPKIFVLLAGNREFGIGFLSGTFEGQFVFS
jgi:hypothetical protein